MNTLRTTGPSEERTVESHFIVGQDATGRWLALETHRIGGGVFTSRQRAIHFVELEPGRRTGAYELSSAPLILSF